MVPFSPEDAEAINNYRRALDRTTKFILTWVKVAVAGWVETHCDHGRREDRQDAFDVCAGSSFGRPRPLKPALWRLLVPAVVMDGFDQARRLGYRDPEHARAYMRYSSSKSLRGRSASIDNTLGGDAGLDDRTVGTRAAAIGGGSRSPGGINSEYG